jgi:hypothetical protein
MHRERAQDRAERFDFLLPTRPRAFREESGAEIKIVIFRGAVVVVTSLGFGQPISKIAHHIFL